MGGEDRSNGRLFSYVDGEARVPADHPLRLIRVIVNEVLASLPAEFESLCSHSGRPGIAPEKLLRGLSLQALYSIRSERQLMARLNFDLLFRWFVGLALDDAVWDATVFRKNRDRHLAADVSGRLLSGAAIGALDRAYGQRTVFLTWTGSDEMFSTHLGDEAELKARRW